MNQTDIYRWYRVALFNLCILGLMGIVLRYKLVFPLPFLEYKKMLHSHSHFAFGGWVSFLLQLIIIHRVIPIFSNAPRFWNWFFLLTTLVNYGMLFSFAYQGYAAVSIIFSTSSLLLSYIYVIAVIRGMHATDRLKVSGLFILASFFFLVISSGGPYMLAWLMQQRAPDLYLYHNALYWFLHFQYNGWFTFAIMGILMHKLERSPQYNKGNAMVFFIILLITCLPAYFLTFLIKERPLWITTLNVFSAIGQAIALFYFTGLLLDNVKQVFRKLPMVSRWLFTLSFLAFGIKIVLQFISAHPQLGIMAFSYRPVIIGYLHLVFLAFASLFLLAWLADTRLFDRRQTLAKWGIYSFAFFVFVYELLLATQGVGAITGWFSMTKLNMALFINTIFLLVSPVLILLASSSKSAVQK